MSRTKECAFCFQPLAECICDDDEAETGSVSGVESDPLPLGLTPEDLPPLPAGAIGWNIYNALPAEPVFHGFVPREALPETG